jgi:hypothetical protein
VILPKKTPSCPDLSQFSADELSPKADKSDRLPRPRRGELYLGGRMPMSWAERAAVLPGRAWQLACALWFEATCGKRRATVSVSTKTRKRFGLQRRQTFYRALAALERAGLVSVDRRRGRAPLVTILDIPESTDE